MPTTKTTAEMKQMLLTMMEVAEQEPVFDIEKIHQEIAKVLGITEFHIVHPDSRGKRAFKRALEMIEKSD